MVDIARGMGMKTIAEFVEAAETVEMLREKGVDYSQGYFHGAPRPVATEFATLTGAAIARARARRAARRAWLQRLRRAHACCATDNTISTAASGSVRSAGVKTAIGRARGWIRSHAPTVSPSSASGEWAPRSASGHSPSASSVRCVTPIVGMLQLGAEVDREAGAARVVAAGGVDDQDVGRAFERCAPPLQHRAGAAAPSRPGRYSPSRSIPVSRRRLRRATRRRPPTPTVARAARAGLVGGEADEAAGDARALGRQPRLRRARRQRLLRGDQRVECRASQARNSGAVRQVGPPSPLSERSEPS